MRNFLISKDNVCKHIEENSDEELLKSSSVTPLFASAQCTGYNRERRVMLTKEMCKPSLVTILREVSPMNKAKYIERRIKVENEVKRINAQSVFVSSDRHHFIEEIQHHFERLEVFI